MSREKHILIRDHKNKGEFYQLCEPSKKSQNMSPEELTLWKTKNSFIWRMVSCPICLEMRDQKRLGPA